MVLLEQISAMLDFLERHTELALGHCSRTSEGRSLAKRRWVQCAQILNCVAENCPTKSATEWRSFYNEYKCKLTKKIKLQKQEMNATGGGPAKKITLTPLQERLYTILGQDIGEPLAVRHNPISVKRRRSSSDLEPTTNQPPRRLRRWEEERDEKEREREAERAALEASQARLEQIEDKNAEATLAQARATENLAAAIDRLGAATDQAANRLAIAIEKVGDIIGKVFGSLQKGSESDENE